MSASYERKACGSCRKVIWRPLGEPAADAVLVCGLCKQSGGQVNGECLVCRESGVVLEPKSVRDGECLGHRFCHACWQTHIETKVRERSAVIPCMHPGCVNKLEPRDVKRFRSDLYKQFLQNKYRDYETRLQAIFLEGDDPFAQWARSHTQSCPQCHVLVERSEGCNHMRCQCGFEFCYRCGRPTSDDCNCPYAQNGPELISGRPDELRRLQAVAEQRTRGARTLQAAFLASARGQAASCRRAAASKIVGAVRRAFKLSSPGLAAPVPHPADGGGAADAAPAAPPPEQEQQQHPATEALPVLHESGEGSSDERSEPDEGSYRPELVLIPQRQHSLVGMAPPSQPARVEAGAARVARRARRSI